MKAAVLHQLGQAPKYEDFADPVAQREGQVVITMKAAAVKNLDKGRASGAHYASYTELPAVVGIDGVGVLPDGRRVYAAGITGMIAEKALIDEYRSVVIPDGVDDVTAAALTNAVLGAALALRCRAGMKQDDVVLINGATGVTGRAAVQIARHYGAKRIIATGRNAASLSLLPALGADDVLSLRHSDEDFVKALKEIHSATPIDIVIDYTWGHPAELIISALSGGGGRSAWHKISLVTVGGMAGENISLPSSALRSTPIQILGSGMGSWPPEAMKALQTEILPEMFQLAAKGGLKIETATAPLSDIEAAWTRDIDPGKRLVIVM